MRPRCGAIVLWFRTPGLESPLHRCLLLAPGLRDAESELKPIATHPNNWMPVQSAFVLFQQSRPESSGWLEKVMAQNPDTPRATMN